MYKIIMLILCSIAYSIGLAQEYKIDSIVQITNDRKFVSIYQEEKNSSRREIISYELKETGAEIVEKSSSINTYDDNGKLLVSMDFEWNFVKNVWDTVYKVESKYDMKGRMIHSASFEKKDRKLIKEYEQISTYNADTIIEFYYHLEDELFLPYFKKISFSNLHDNDQETNDFIWDQNTQSWKKNSRSVLLYQPDSTVMGYVQYTGKDNEWKNEQKVLYEFDKEGNRTENYITYKGIDKGWILDQRFVDSDSIVDGKKMHKSSVYTWDETEKIWVLTSDTKRFQNEKEKDIEIVSYAYNAERQQLQLSYQKMFEYNSKDDVKLDQSLTYQDNILSEGFQTTYEYDNDDNLISLTIFKLDIVSNTWVEFKKTEYSFIKVAIANDESKETVLGTSDSDIFFRVEKSPKNVYNIKSIKDYYFVDNKVVLKEEEIYYYSIMKR